MKNYQKILLIIGTILMILFILYGIPSLADILKASTGYDFKFLMYLGVVFLLYLVGRIRGGGKYSKLNNQLRIMEQELIKTHNIENYIAQNKRLYKQTEDKRYRGLILSNIAMAYYLDGKYDKSNNVIEKMDMSQFNEGQLATIYNQQYMGYVHSKQFSKAKEVYDKNKALFEKYENNKDYHSHFVVCRLLYDLGMAGKDEIAITKVRKQFDEISISQKEYKTAFNYRLLEGKLLIAEGKGKEGRDNLRLLEKENLMPGLKAEVSKALKY